MTDLKKTQTEWTDFFREWFTYIRPLRILVDIRRRFSESRNRVLEQFDIDKFTSNWTLSGVERGINATEDGQLFVKILDETPGAGEATIELYKDAAQGAPDLVATGNGPDSTTITLVEANSSGITGSVDIAVITASPTDRILLVDIDEPLKGTRAFALDNGGRAAQQKFLARMSSLITSLNGIITTTKSDLEVNFVRTRMAEFLKSTATLVISAAEAADANGDIQVTFSGLLEEITDAMGDESVAGAQTISPNVVTATTPEFDPDNVGLGSLATLAFRENAPAGRVTFLCNVGAADTLEETFGVTMKLTTGQTVSAASDLQIKKEWESASIGLRAQLSRTPVITGDDDVDISTVITDGETLTNTDIGKLYFNVTSPDAGVTINVGVFSDAARTVKVAEGTRAGVGVVTLTQFGGSGLTGSVLVVTYTSDDIDIIVDLKPFFEGDEIVLDLANDEAGLLQTTIRTVWSFFLPSSGSPSLPDSILAEAQDLIQQES